MQHAAGRDDVATSSHCHGRPARTGGTRRTAAPTTGPRGRRPRGRRRPRRAASRRRRPRGRARPASARPTRPARRAGPSRTRRRRRSGPPPRRRAARPARTSAISTAAPGARRTAARHAHRHSLQPAIAMPWAHVDQVVDRHVLVDRVRPVDRARPVHQRRRARLQRERRAVVPGAQPAELGRQAERARWRRSSACTLAASTGVSDGLTSVCQRNVGGCSASHESVSHQRRRKRLDLGLGVGSSSPCASACWGRISTDRSISARSGIVTCQPASATKRVGDDVRRVEQRVRGGRRGCATRARSRSTPVEQEAALVDRVDRAAVAPVRVLLLGVPGAAGERDRAVDGAAAGRPDLQRARLGDDREVGRDAVARAGQAADAAGLLVGVRADDHVAGAARRVSASASAASDHRRDPALHVARAAADDRARRRPAGRTGRRPSRPRARRGRRRCGR